MALSLRSSIAKHRSHLNAALECLIMNRNKFREMFNGKYGVPLGSVAAKASRLAILDVCNRDGFNLFT
ncbi:hypothetical protein CGI81_24055 [Vibrio parahaemolyticus]|nr:hypothetical protein CGI81_24055 [Vibrio parahaemolyticus]